MSPAVLLSEVRCMDCGAVTGLAPVEGSTGLCDVCLEKRYPAGNR